MKYSKYYSLLQKEREAEIVIYGDIVPFRLSENDVSNFSLVKEIEGLDVDVIHVYINSYGGETAEGLAVYNALKRHPALIKTYCDGFACSAASLVFMAGQERIMSECSLLMIHNAWQYAAGNADELRKMAADLDTISQTAANVYRAAVSISGDELNKMLDNETWIAPEQAVAMGFATGITPETAGERPTQGVRKALSNIVLQWQWGRYCNEEWQKAKNGVLSSEQKFGVDPKQQENKVMRFLNALGR